MSEQLIDALRDERDRLRALLYAIVDDAPKCHWCRRPATVDGWDGRLRCDPHNRDDKGKSEGDERDGAPAIRAAMEIIYGGSK